MSGSIRIWYSFVGPPKLETSTTFGTDLNCFSRTQSSSDFKSITSYLGLRAGQRVPVDLSDRAPVRPHLRLNVIGQGHLRKALQRLLPVPVVYGIVVEDQGDAGKPEHRFRAQTGEMRNSVHHDFDRNRDLLFHFFRRAAGPLRDDVDVVVRHVGIRLDRQIGERNGAPDQQEDGPQQHQKPVVQREIDDGPNHLCTDCGYRSDIMPEPIPPHCSAVF